MCDDDNIYIFISLSLSLSLIGRGDGENLVKMSGQISQSAARVWKFDDIVWGWHFFCVFYDEETTERMHAASSFIFQEQITL